MPATHASMSALKIVLVIDSLAGGGAEKVVLELARALKEVGHQVYIVSLSGYSTYEVPADIPVSFLYQDKRPKLHSKKLRAEHALALTRLMREIEAEHGAVDFIFSNLDYSHYIVSACNFSHTAYVIHNAINETLSRALKMGPFKWWRQRRMFKSLNDQPCIAVSEGLKQELLRHPLVSPANVTRIYNPFNLARIRELAGESNHHIPREPYLIHIGRFARQKRHDLLFEALRLLPSVKLVCLGANEGAIRRLAAKTGVSARVIVPGFQQNPYCWIRSAACLVLSSDYEGFGNVLVEALACNTPVVATDCPHGPNEILIHEQARNLVPRNNPQALADAIAWVLADPGQKNYSEESLLRFDHHTIARQYVDYVIAHRTENRKQTS